MAYLIELEQKLLNLKLSKLPAEIEKLLAPEFVEFGATGIIYDRQSIIQALSKEEEAHMSATDFRSTILSDDVVLLTYRSTWMGSQGTIKSLRSSIWKQENGHWQMTFHQGTRII